MFFFLLLPGMKSSGLKYKIFFLVCFPFSYIFTSPHCIGHFALSFSFKIHVTPIPLVKTIHTLKPFGQDASRFTSLTASCRVSARIWQNSVCHMATMAIWCEHVSPIHYVLQPVPATIDRLAPPYIKIYHPKRKILSTALEQKGKQFKKLFLHCSNYG